jgi:hypothetical protein
MTLTTGVDRDNASRTLRAVATLVERAHPGVAPTAAEGVKESLMTSLGKGTAK